MKKSEIENRMPDYLEGDLPLEDRALFDAYLDSHEDAAQEISELRRTVALLRGLPDPEPPPSLVDDVMQRVLEGEARPSRLSRLRSALGELLAPRIAVPATAMAALAAVAIVRGDLRLPSFVVPPAGSPAATEIASAPASSPAPSPVRPAPSPAATAEAPMSAPREVARAEPPVEGSRDRSTLRLDHIFERPPGASVPPPLLPEPTSLQAMTAVSDSAARPTLIPTAGNSGLPSTGTGEYVRIASKRAPVVADPSPEKEARRREQLDQRLDALLEDPISFARWLTGDSYAAQELWLTELSERVVERDLEDRVIRALEESGDVDAVRLGGLFAQSLARARTDVVAEGRE